MTSGRYGLVLREVGRLLGGGTVAAMREGQLLERFAADRDPAAFEALVSRHGPMVLGTCRRMLNDPHDVDDAFQATFLVLARKAGSIRDADRLGPWLHGVARRVATRSRALSARRSARERSSGEDLAVEAPDASEAAELREALDEELSRLPEKYRAPLVLCYLEGLTHDEAAEHLRWPVGTVRSRLAGGRDRLRARLTRRGLAPSAAVPAVLPHVSMPQALLSTTVRIATSAGSAPAHVAILAKGALVAMMWSKLKVITAVGLLASLTVAGVSVAAQKVGDGQAVVPEPAQTARELSDRVGGLQKDLDAANIRIGKLEKLVAEQRDMIQSQQDRREYPVKPADAATSAVDRPRMKAIPKGAIASKPEAGPGGVSGPEATPGATEPPRLEPPPAQPTVMTLSGNPPLLAVVSGERDRVTIVDSATKERATFRIPGGAKQIVPVEGSYLSLIIRGPEVNRTALYDRQGKRWYEFDLKEPATEVSTTTGSSMMATGMEPTGLSIIGPTITRVAVFDQRDKKWTTHDLKETAHGGITPHVTPTTVTYVVGRGIYTYSAIARKWSVLELKRLVPGFQTFGDGRLIAPDGDLIHTYDPKTGEWTEIDTKDEK